MFHVTSYPPSTWRIWLCLRAVRVKSGRMASRLFSRPQWAVMSSGVTMTTGSTAGLPSSCWVSWEVTESLLSVSLWPVRHINRQLIETNCQSVCEPLARPGLEILWLHLKKKQMIFQKLYYLRQTCRQNGKELF